MMEEQSESEQNSESNMFSEFDNQPDLGDEGVEDMVNLVNLNETSLLWNIKLRYEKEIIYTFTGSILVSVNPYKMYDIYGLNMVKKYEGQILGTLPPHLFAIASSAYTRMTKDNEDQVVIISGESGAGKTENTKLFMQYLAAVNKSPSNIITEQILEATPLLESFGNAKTIKNDNSSRFGKYLEVHFKDGIITGAKTTEYLLEKSRIVTQPQDERNYHVFYELLDGLTEEEKEKYGLLNADKYFYLNQGSSPEIDGKNDGEDFRFLLAAMQVLGFTNEEQDTIFRILASVLHLGNIFFHRKQLIHGQEGVEVGSDAEIRWVAHLLHLPLEGIFKALTVKTTEARNERMVTPLNIDQALDARDAIAKALYSSLFSWLVQRVNLIVYKGSKKTTIAILDIFGFEDFKENSFEQLCINYANETLQSHFNKFVFKLEQQEYLKEKIDWQTLTYPDNQQVLNLISKKPIGIMPLLDDESNFPKATDNSFLEKCHYNHALNELYSRPRMSSMEFGIKHYAGQVWYTVDGFLEKNRDTLRSDVIDLLINSKMPMISRMFQSLRESSEMNKSFSRNDGRFITMKPRAPTVSARFQDSLSSLLDIMSKYNPWFVRCIKPNNQKAPMKFEIPIVLEQLRYSGMLETIRIRKLGYPIKMKFQQFTNRYRCLLVGKKLRGTSSKEVCKMILTRNPSYNDQYQLGLTKIFLRESLEKSLENERVNLLYSSAIAIQRHIRGFLARQHYKYLISSIIKIQSAFRAYKQRRDYLKIKGAIIQIQANYRMIKQKRIYEKMKALHKRQMEADREAFERAKEKTAREELERTRAVAGVNHLEIPAELAYILGKLDDWNCPHESIVKASSHVRALRLRYNLPNDIDFHAFTKFTNIYFRAHIWGMKREPIKTPFLAKNNEFDFQESLAIFKLILRFMNDNNLSGKKEKVLADYIVQKGLSNPALRDEILCQLCNQTWKNENLANNERGWQLLTYCLRSFAPSPILFKYLLKYVSDHGCDGYKALAQKLLLQSEYIEPQNVRTYPPTLLEWKATSKKSNMSLETSFTDGDTKYASVDSWTTGEIFASELLKSKGVNSTFGWTIQLDDDGDNYELNGNDYVLDLISEIEIPPSFPVSKSYFLVSADRSKSRTDKKSPHNPEKINKYQFDSKEPIPIPSIKNYYSKMDNNHNKLHKYAPNGHYRGRSMSSENIIEKEYSNRNSAEFNVNPSPLQSSIGLSKKSKLNERYLNKKSAIEKIKLSETSKLNQRYVKSPIDDKINNYRKSDDVLLQTFVEPQLVNKRSKSMQELGLASSALNDRYFASRTNLHKTTSLVGGSAHLVENKNIENLASFKEENIAEHFSSSRQMPTELPDGNQIESNRNHHVIRPSSRSSSSISSNASNDYPIIDDELHKEKNDITNAHFKNNEPNSRYRKYNRGDSIPSTSRFPPYSHNTKAYIDRSVSREGDYMGVRGSAMSDTSESPSLASHVKNIRIPSHTSELDQYLDDLFNPVLDANIDELSDARSLAASIKGGSKGSNQNAFDEDSILEDINIEEFDYLNKPDELAFLLKGGGRKEIKTPSKSPVGLSSSSSEGALSHLSDQKEDQQSNGIPLMNIAGMTVPLVDTSQLIQQQVLHQQMIQMQQRAFLASAVQQNLEMQKQLMQQNQQLQQLLVQSSVSPTGESQILQMSPSPMLSQTHLDPLGLSLSSPNLKTPSPLPNLDSSVILNLSKSISELQFQGNSVPPPPPPPPLPTSSPLDVYGRVKTVRIGKKYRWPPPVEKTPVEQQSFLEFKLKKQQEKSDKNEDFHNQSVDFPEISNMDNHALNSQNNVVKQIEKPTSGKVEEVVKITPKAPPGSVGKLRISSEMKAKLEQLTIDQSVRSKDNKERKAIQSRSMDDISNSGVKKLSEQRKALLEQQLMGSIRNNDFMERNSSPNKRLGQKVDSADNIHMKTTQNGLIIDKHTRKSGSRENRERKDELGPFNRMSGTIASTINAECGDRMSQSTVQGHYFDDTSTINSMAYQESISSNTTHQRIFPNNHSGDHKVKRMSVPPPPPPLLNHQMNPTYQSLTQLNQVSHSGPSSIAPSSSYYAQQSPIVIRHNRNIPPPMVHSLSHDRLSFDRIDLEESSEFLNPIDVPPQSIISKSHQETIKTKLYEISDQKVLTYPKHHWNLRVRKEVFSPGETMDNPLMIQLVFFQILQDAFSSTCIRLTSEEKLKLQSQLKMNGIDRSNILSCNPKINVKRNMIEMMKEFPTYFSRLYPISGGRNLSNVDLLGISHSGVRLIKRERDAICDYLRTVDALSLNDIYEVLVPKKFTLQIVLAGGGWLTLFSPKANQIKHLIDLFIFESQRNEVEFVRAIKDCITKEPSLLSFRKGNVIRIVKNKNLQLSKGWLFGVTETGEGGVFPCESVVPLNKQEILRISRKMDEVMELQNGHASSYMNNTPEHIKDHHKETNVFGLNEQSCQDDNLWVESKNEQLDDTKSDLTQNSQLADGKFSLLQFALFNFRESLERYDFSVKEGSIRGSIKLIENIKAKKKGKKSKNDQSDWTWRELSDLVKFTKEPIQASLLKLASQELNKLAVECFIAIMRYMGDHPMLKNQTEVDCVYTILLNCHKFPQLRDEVYCQIMKQTTTNKSTKFDSCQRGWRLFSIVAAYFDCSDLLKPYLFKYLETAAYDKRRAYHATANICLKNLRKTFKYGGRKNVPSIEEIAAISAGRNSRRQIYRLPGGTERIINTKSTTVVSDIIEEICVMLNVTNPVEMEEFSLYCIIEGDPYTMPLNIDEYILDVTTELLKNGQVFYLIFCRSVWYYPLKLDSHLYIEVIFNQVAPDYLEGLLLIIPNEKLSEETIPQIARIAALLHRAADMEHMPTKDEVKYLLPKPVLPMRDVRPPQWVEMVQNNWNDMSALTTTEAKAQCLDILQKWQLFGSCFFAVKRIQNDSPNHPDHILALNKEGVHFLDIITHETIWKHPFNEVISTRKVRAEDGTLFLDMKCGNLMVQKITRIQTDQAHEISRLIRQYIEIEQHCKNVRKEVPHDVTSSRLAIDH